MTHGLQPTRLLRPWQVEYFHFLRPFSRQEYWSALLLLSIPGICKYYFKEKCHCRYDSIKTLDIGSYPSLPEWALKTIASILIREKQTEVQHYIQMKAEVHAVKAMGFPVVIKNVRVRL